MTSCIHASPGPWLAAALAVGSFASHATGTELHVPGDFPTIQTAIDAASGGDEIVVAPGIYNETIDFVSKSDLTLRSAQGPAETILDGRCLGRTMLRVEEGSTGVTIEGFTLRNADPQGGTLTSPQLFFCCGHNGGAILVWGESDAEIHDCIFRDNVLDVPASLGNFFSSGAALAVIQGSTVTITDSEFIDNLLPALEVGANGGAAIRVDQQSTFAVTGTRFHGNRAPDLAKGGAIYLRDSTAEVVECTFTENVADNKGGAIYATGSSNLVVTDSQFRANSVTTTFCGGAAILGPSTITGCVFADNTAGAGSAVCTAGLVQNSAFCNNQPGHIAEGWQDGGGNTFDASNCGRPPPPPVLTYGYEFGYWNFNVVPAGTVPMGAPLPADFGIGELDLSGWGGSAQTVTGSALNGMWCELAGQGLALPSPHGDGNGTGVDFHLDTSGLENLEVSYAAWRGNNAPILHTWLWSIDGTTFNQLEQFAVEPPASWHVREVDFSAVDELDDAESVTLRLVLDGGPDEVLATTTYFDNILIQGEFIPPPPGDLDGDGVVGTADLLALLGAWGACPPSGACPADLDGDGLVGTADLLVILTNWG